MMEIKLMTKIIYKELLLNFPFKTPKDVKERLKRFEDQENLNSIDERLQCLRKNLANKIVKKGGTK